MARSLGKTVLFRTAILVGMASVVTTIIYLTPVPGQEYVSCDRPCHELEMPMICRVRLVLEPYHTLTRACGHCPRNSSECFARHCVTADGNSRALMTANRQLPGPNIHVCEHDILVVDVVNRLPGIEVAVHWRGQPLHETPFMDGVPMVTQCPVPSATIFQYKLRASNPGTHLWQAHPTAALAGEGIFGALIVRQTESRIVHRRLYDRDDVSHVAVMHTWRSSHGDLVLLINGHSQSKRQPGKPGEEAAFPAARFRLSPRRRHLLRLAHSGGPGRCSVSVSLDKHVLLVIAVDGAPVVPRQAAALRLAPGERADVVVEAAHPTTASYLLRVDVVPGCPDPVLGALATVSYDADVEPRSPESTPELHEVEPRPAESAPELHEVGATQLEAWHKMARALRSNKMDVTVGLRFAVRDVEVGDLSWGFQQQVSSTNNLTFIFPSSPLLTQPDDVTDLRCHHANRPSHCADAEPCECLHVIDIALGSTVELQLSDSQEGGRYEQVFHLHGHSFHVVAVTDRQLNAAAPLLRNLLNPVVKDTVAVPVGGMVALRFTADNPGYWLLENAQTPGMNVVFHVGRHGDGPPTPAGFPQCHSFVGPDFFLI